MERKFKRRSLLYVPGSSQKMVHKALTLDGVDGIIFDLEDSVSVSEKENARTNVSQALQEIRKLPEHREIIVRINLFTTPFALDDLVAVTRFSPDALIITKATREILTTADMVVGMLEQKYRLPAGKIRLIPLIETAIGIEDIYGILQASARITAAQFGAEDYTRDMGINRQEDNSELLYARNKLSVACRACGVDCLDTPYVNFKDLAGYEEDTRYIKKIGMTGRVLIHPSLATLTNQIFSPTETEIQYAREVIAAYEISEKEGRGATSLNGKMIDAPVVERARALLQQLSI